MEVFRHRVANPGIKSGLHGIGHQNPVDLVMVFMKLVVAVFVMGINQNNQTSG
jgi:hypothetical protein